MQTEILVDFLAVPRGGWCSVSRLRCSGGRVMVALKGRISERVVFCKVSSFVQLTFLMQLVQVVRRLILVAVADGTSAPADG